MRESRWQARAGVLNRLSARLLPAGLTLARPRQPALTPISNRAMDLTASGGAHKIRPELPP
ncbi:hypothetical protein C5688_19050 [Methylocystis sp. MitZ-2018]|nr:hypothetical protein C5688_19050 [Methylocystis sp. MitZ-2018]